MRLPPTEDVVVALSPGRFRRWLNSDMRVMRWVFLGLYLAVVGTCVALSFGTGEPIFIAAVAIALVAQVIFILGGGTVRLCQPVRRRRLWLPVTITALMLTVLLLGFFCAMIELFKLDKASNDNWAIAFWGFLGLCWIGWGVLLFFHVAELPRFRLMSSLTRYLFAGSLAELIATVPAHMIVSRRPGCFVGLLTIIGIISGIGVMLFSFGPMIVLLFLRPRLRAETFDPNRPICPACGYDLRATPHRCPECGLLTGVEAPVTA
jgi:hypothetical protein